MILWDVCNDFLPSTTTTKSNGHLADFVEGVALAAKEKKRKETNNVGGVGDPRLTRRSQIRNAGEGGDVRRGGGGACAGGGGRGQAARRVAARAWPAPASARGGAVDPGAVAAPAQQGLLLCWRRRWHGGVLHRERAVRGAGRAPEELRRVPRLQQAPQGLLAPRLVAPRTLIIHRSVSAPFLSSFFFWGSFQSKTVAC